MPRWSLLAALPALRLATYTPEQLEQARENLRHELRHIGAQGHLIEGFVDQLMEDIQADTDNQHNIEDWTSTVTHLDDWGTMNGPRRGDVIREEFLSPEFKLKTGGAHFTLNPTYKVPVPSGDYVILNQTWEIVGDDAESGVPLTQMYNHHWLIGGELWPTSLCEGDYFFGGGAEYRNMDYTFPEGYGMARVGASGQCGANLHFINTEDLATQWKGFNNPDGNHAGAVKLAAECGWEPGRAVYCDDFGDGSFLCCFTGSRAQVNNPKDKTKRSYRLKATFEYTRDFSTAKHLQMGLLDVGGNLRTEHGQYLDVINEWGVAPNLNNEGVYTRCNATVCTAQRTQVVGDGSRYGYGLCSGDMLWGYMHMHAGGILGTMAVNGEEYCVSEPVAGTDPTNPVGNEEGFLVKVTECVDHKIQGNKIRLNQGDVVTLTQTYDVDPASTRYAPFPGGKHGGIMALFFAMMDCDAGTFAEVYVKRNDTCVPTPASKCKGKACPHYADLATCQSDGELAEEVEVVQESQALVVPEPEEPEDPEDPEGILPTMNLLWRDCGGPNKWVNFTGLDQSKLKLGRKTKIKALGQLNREITNANLTVNFASGALGLTLGSIDDEACNKKHGFWTLIHNIHLEYHPLGCPMPVGDFSGQLDVYVSPLIPKLIGHTTTTLVAHTAEEEIFCLEVITTAGDTPNGNEIPAIVV